MNGIKYKVEGVNGFSRYIEKSAFYFDTKKEAFAFYRKRNQTWENMNALIKITNGVREVLLTNGGYNTL